MARLDISLPLLRKMKLQLSIVASAGQQDIGRRLLLPPGTLSASPHHSVYPNGKRERPLVIPELVCFEKLEVRVCAPKRTMKLAKMTKNRGGSELRHTPLQPKGNIRQQGETVFRRRQNEVG
jgi:hypothetical protein